MKYFTNMMIIIPLFLTSTLTFACPSLILSSKIYTEISIPCDKSVPDYTQPVLVNQKEINGSECRVQLDENKTFRVIDNKLIISNENGHRIEVGQLLSSPSCYQNDELNNYEGSWTVVKLNDN